jgi:hypothetical protein
MFTISLVTLAECFILKGQLQTLATIIVFSRSIVLDSESEEIREMWDRFVEVNRLNEYMVKIEELLAKFGEVDIVLISTEIMKFQGYSMPTLHDVKNW